MHRPTAVLFDKDGTILPFSPFWTTWTAAFRGELEASGVLADAPAGMLDWPANTRTASHGASLDVATMQVLRERVAALLIDGGVDPQEARRTVEAAARVADARTESLPVEAHAGFDDAVRGLRAQDIALGLVTGDDEARASRQLLELGLIHDFSIVVGGDRGLPGKPSPATLLAACDALAVAPSDCAYVGDSLVDVRAARAAGFMTAIVYVPHDAEALPEWAGEADEVIRDLDVLAGRWAASSADEQ